MPVDPFKFPEQDGTHRLQFGAVLPPFDDMVISVFDDSPWAMETAFMNEYISCDALALPALLLALERLDSTTLERRAMIEMTTRSSMRVKPCRLEVIAIHYIFIAVMRNGDIIADNT